MESACRETTTKARLDAILAHLAREGYARREPKLLQPAALFLDRKGEDFRGRLLLATDAAGGEYCLRPEFTIPVCRDYLASPEAGKAAAYAYGGAVFRSGAHGGADELTQAGLESFGRADREAADVEILGATLDAAAAAGARNLRVKLGDAGIVSAFLDALALPPVWRRRLETGRARGLSLDAIFAPPTGVSEQAGVLAALEKVDGADARKLVEDLLSIAGIAAVGGRGADEIAERFLEQAQLSAGAPVEKRALAETFFAIEGAPDMASMEMRRFADAAGLDLAAALDVFDNRAGFIAARGLALDEMAFSTAFARHLDYYSGFVFEAHHAADPDGEPLLGGGRYDRMLKTLGAEADIPAVGAAIFVDRIAAEAA